MMMTTTETQIIPLAQSAPIHKFSRYRSVREVTVPPSISSRTKQPSSNSQNESVVRSMSRYRKRSSKPDPPSTVSSQPAPEQNIRPAPTKIPQSHAATLAALTGELYIEEPEMPASLARKDALARPRQSTSPRKITSPVMITDKDITTPQARQVPPLEDSPQPRQVSWEALCAARAKAQALQSQPQAQQSLAHQNSSDVLTEEEEHMRSLKARRTVEREAKLEKRRAVEAEEKRRERRIDAEQHERRRIEHDQQEQARRDTQQRQDEERMVPDEKVAAPKKESPGLHRGTSIRKRLGSFTRKRSAELLGSGKTQKLPEKDDLPASSRRRRRGTVSKSRPGSDSLASNTEAAKEPTRANWIDAPITRPIPSPPPVPGPSQWVDAPVSRPAPPEEGPVILPQYDAPVSAVNAGERHVLVRCNVSSRSFTVTPTTTPKDLINSASLVMSESIDPRHSKLVESFAQLGLERPLRNYEHIRDVMNSWDNDTQNSFVILSIENDTQYKELHATAVPQEPPGDISVRMYYSQRPGSWDKRWMTLRPDGQVTIAKRQGQTSSNICHLTDFDIYMPTPRQQSKKIRPPKKICFAVKSQQKSNVFLDGANFVHFFATNDQAIASEWYRAVQGWRSWYLVNILGEGQKSKRTSTTTPSLRPASIRSQRRASIDGATYQLGSFKPLLDFGTDAVNNNNNTTAPGRGESKSANVFHARKMSNRDRAPPPSAFPNNNHNHSNSNNSNKLSKDADSSAPTTTHHRSPKADDTTTTTTNTSKEPNNTTTFPPTSLLGRTYSHRQKAQRDRETSTSNTTPASSNDKRTQTMRSTTTNTTIPPQPQPQPLTHKPSTKSISRPLKPLIDLTPQFHEPPQHVRKGRGVTVEPGRQLVDVATGWDLPPTAIVTPSARAWRRGNGSGSGSGSGSGGSGGSWVGSGEGGREREGGGG